MMMILIYLFFVMMLSNVIMFMGSIISKKMYINREKNTPFECGFDPNSSARMSFSLQFFLIAMIFLIFDVEITLLMPLSILMGKMNLLSWVSNSWIFILILLYGLYYEWKEGALNWLM